MGIEYFRKICGSVQRYRAFRQRSLGAVYPLKCMSCSCKAKKRRWRVEVEEKVNSCLMYEKICQAPTVKFNSWVLQAQENNVIYVITVKRLVRW